MMSRMSGGFCALQWEAAALSDLELTRLLLRGQGQKDLQYWMCGYVGSRPSLSLLLAGLLVAAAADMR